MSVLAKAAAAIDLVARSHEPVRLSDAATALGMPKSSAHRLLGDLVDSDLLRRDASGRFLLGIRLLTWGQAAESSFDIRGLALPHMRRLSELTGETVNLHVPQGEYRVCVATQAGANIAFAPVVVGQALPLGIGATGKLLLAFSPEPLRTDVLEELRRTGRPVPSADELARIRGLRWATSQNEQEVGMSAGATVVTGVGGKVLAALAVGGDVERLPQARLDALREDVLRAASAIADGITGAEG
ncbi:IclR family transcriptional regulator [Nocardioides sp. zg-536]|uniref:IclR family transcriptional regulator n=1 Tax=Nocardioides faecalis TaxID=2803858 RepID=A0A939BX12_9ACTN|nr:IclR family transcriptional regulator [Nocardioides faecalis]MBM9461202.1 IclR family transcriptional regulator [Nocardioides faecalis]QVI59050.1 IclR family transcriptional regulator [Nocardioides faecalis]